MNSKERILCALKHVEPDRVPVYDSLWEKTITRWHSEGLPMDKSPSDYFGYEMSWYQPDISPQFELEIVEEDEEYIIQRNNFGEIIKDHKDHSTTPLILESPVKSKRDWQEIKERLTINKNRLKIYKNLFNPQEDSIVSWEDTLKRFENDNKNGRFITFTALIGFDMIQRYLGSENLLIKMLEDPSWVKDIFTTHAKFIIELFEFVQDSGLSFDGIFFANDMGYKNGPMFSPELYKDLIMPSDKLLCEYFHDLDIPVFLHSDGDIRKLIPGIIESGFDCLQPLEVKANMDIIEIKKEFGDRIALMGGIDVRLMYDPDPNKIKEEIKKKFSIARKNGGYIYHSDHSIPYDVSFDQYEYVMKLVREYGDYRKSL